MGTLIVNDLIPLWAFYQFIHTNLLFKIVFNKFFKLFDKKFLSIVYKAIFLFTNKDLL
jgi:hypothetical protein